MGHDKLRKFAENETFACLLQPSSSELLTDGYFNLKDHPVKGSWSGFFSNLSGRQPDKGRPMILELGCGKGEYTIGLAQKNPDKDYVGVDIKGARLWKGAGYASRLSMPNVAFLRTRIEFITAFFAPGEVSEVWLTFSDPQMKSENSRLSSPMFLDRYRSFLKKGGVVHLKTDSRFLHEYTKAVCAANGLEVLCCTEDLYGGERIDVDPLVYEVQTFYESMFLEQGYPITYMSFIIDHEGEFVHPGASDLGADAPSGAFDGKYWREVEGPRRSFSHKAPSGR